MQKKDVFNIGEFEVKMLVNLFTLSGIILLKSVTLTDI